LLKIVPFLARECRFGAMIASKDFDQVPGKNKLRIFFSKYSSWIVPWHVIEAKIICQNQNDIWLFARSAKCFRYKKRSEKRRKQEHRRRFSLNLRFEDFRF
jgi:hypothetical protein